MYRPPNTDASDFTASIEETLYLRYKVFVVVEMLNTLLEDGTETVLTLITFYRVLQRKISSAQQIITQPTRITEHSRTQIDLFFTSRPELYVAGVLQVGFSDHSAIFGVRKFYRVPLPPPRIVTARNYRRYDPALFSESLNNIPWDILDLEQNPDEALECFNDLFQTAADKHAPVVTRRVRGKSVPWLTPSIKDLMHERDFQHKKAIKTNQEIHWSNCKRLCNTVNMKMESKMQLLFHKVVK